MQTNEPYDIVNQLSVAWIGHLKKWVMFYGGGLTNLPYPPTLIDCGILEIFVGTECKDVVMGNGAIRMRTADDPWGPWSPPQDVIVGGVVQRVIMALRTKCLDRVLSLDYQTLARDGT